MPGRDEQPGLLAEQLRGALLEGVDRRVVAEDVVADLGLGHRPAHRRASGWVTVSLRRSIRGMGGEYRTGSRSAPGRGLPVDAARMHTRSRPVAAGRGRGRVTGDATELGSSAGMHSSCIIAGMSPARRAGDKPGDLCYAPPSPQLDPWCSGPTCQPVTLEIAGSNPVGSATSAFPYAPSARPDGAFLCPGAARGVDVWQIWQNPPVKTRPLLAALGVLAAVLVVTVLVGVRRDRCPTATPPDQVGLDVGGAARRPRGRPARRRRRRPRPPSRARAHAVRRPRRRRPCRSRSRSCRSRTSGPPQTSTSLREVQAVLAGTSGRYDGARAGRRRGRRDPRGARARPPAGRRPARPGRRRATPSRPTSPGHRKRLGFLRADAVGPSVRALAWGGDALFGVDRVTSLADWPLVARVPGRATAADAFDPVDDLDPVRRRRHPARSRRLQDAGRRGQGRDFPFDGGTAEITSRYCCSAFGWELPRTKRTGNAGAFRDLIEGADLAIANFENPAPDRFRWHTRGTVFSADPALIDGPRRRRHRLRVPRQQPHPRRRRPGPPPDDRQHPASEGIAVSGAGKDLAAARKPAMLEAGGHDRRDPRATTRSPATTTRRPTRSAARR